MTAAAVNQEKRTDGFPLKNEGFREGALAFENAAYATFEKRLDFPTDESANALDGGQSGSYL